MNKESYLAICPKCFGRGKKNTKLRKNARRRYQIAVNEFEKNRCEGKAFDRPIATQYLCPNCSGSGLIHVNSRSIADSEKYPHVAIIGAGIGGVALAVACSHRGIPFTLYERDNSFDARAQGYGLTLQQASIAIKGLGLFFLNDGCNSTRHVVHTTNGTEISEWGMRTHSKVNTVPKRKNIHIPRQSLRMALLEQLGEPQAVKWGHRLAGFKIGDNGFELSFNVKGELRTAKADLIVGADGIRSVVRSLLIGEEITPLRYLGYAVILGICPLASLKDVESSLLDSSTVFQTVNGRERIYMMPYKSDMIMWQFSFPISEEGAKTLSAQGTQALKEEACRRASNWHAPIPQILSATSSAQITGYPMYDRELLDAQLLENAGAVTLIGDAAHPMSPFKGQGANQAILDALALARKISLTCAYSSKWKEVGLRNAILTEFEEEMLERSASKVKDSKEAVELLHSKCVLREGNSPKGRCLK